MKFAWKIFFVSFLIIIISFGTGGFILINYLFSSTLSDRTESVCDNNSYITASLYAIEINAESMGYSEKYYNYIMTSFTEQVSGSNSDTKIEIGSAHNMNSFDNKNFIADISPNERACRYVEHEGKNYIQVISRIKTVFHDLYIETITDTTDIYAARSGYCQIYTIVLICVTLFASLVLVFFSIFLTRPLVRLSSATKEIAQGNFSKRVIPKGSKEIRELSESFNTMAQNIEDYSEKLRRSARDKDRFVANFTHELKTPLTSVIGYADMLRSYELDADRRRECADYICNEGKRLEALSSNLLQLMVLRNDEIKLTEISVEILIKEIASSVRFLLKKYEIKVEAGFQPAQISVEPSLIKTLIYNLIDNACKASEKGQVIHLKGEIKNDRYAFTITDEGCGIPKDELDKITQPFYMIDKSRSRKMGGAGLGLSLCCETARLHGSELEFKSEDGKGTEVSFTVALVKEGEAND